jgi:hypothetical protein
MALIVLIFSGLASIPQHETRKPRSLPVVTPNTHFSGFSLVRVRRNLSREDEKNITFITIDSLFCYVSMPYGLKMLCSIRGRGK